MLNTIEEAIEELKKGKLLIVVDDEDRENEGDFVTAARNVTSDQFHEHTRPGPYLRFYYGRALRPIAAFANGSQ